MPSLAQHALELRGALAAAMAMCRVAFALGRRPFPDLLTQFRLGDPLPAAPTALVLRAQTDVRRAHRLLPFERNCLLDSLTAATLVRRQGFSVPLAIGVKKQQGEFLAHAWLGGSSAEGMDGFQLLYRVPHEN